LADFYINTRYRIRYFFSISHLDSGNRLISVTLFSTYYFYSKISRIIDVDAESQH